MENTEADNDEAENPVIFPLLDSEGIPTNDYFRKNYAHWGFA